MPRYEIHVRGRVGPVLLEAFDNLAMEVEPAETVLYGSIPDQAALQALLVQIQSLGLDLTEVRRVRGPDQGEDQVTTDNGG